MTIKIDIIDRAIIELLQIDGRMSAADISRSIGTISVRTASIRIKRLINKNIINIKTIVNRHTIGYGILADIFIDVEPGRVTEIANILCGMEEVSYVGIVTGESDISIQAQQPSVECLQDFVINKLHKIPGVVKTKSFLIAQCLKLSYEWKLPN